VDAGGQESRYPLVLRLRVQLEDPQQALEAARGLASKAVALNTRIALQDGLARRGELKAHLDAAGHRLQLAEEELLTFQRQNQLELLQRDTEALLDERQALLRLIVDIEGEKARLATAEEELRKHQPMLPVARAVAAEEALRRSMAKDDDETPPAPLDLSHPYANPVYQTLEFQIATSRAHLASLEAQRRELMEVRKLGGATLEQLTSQHEHEVEEARRRGAYDLALRVHDDLALRFEQAHTQVLGTGVQLQVIDEGTIPTEPLPRGRLRWMLLGIALGMLSGSLGALVLDAARA
jgi:hypothetical protein